MSELILLVDDSRVQLMTIEKILKEVFPDCEVISFTSPDKALGEIKSKGIKLYLAFLDYNMAGMSGIELAEKLLAPECIAILPGCLTLLSANIQEAVKKKAFDLGIDFIAKPFSKDKLINFLDKKKIKYD